jgi:chromosome partitioning protein
MTPRRNNLNKILILNPKGGCGKSTLVTNIAVCYARHGQTPAVMDYDPQGSTMAWLSSRRTSDRCRQRAAGSCAYPTRRST